jgi:hypothetical protein
MSVQLLSLWKKQLSITYFECVFVAFVIQHTVHMSRVIPSFVVRPGLLYLSTYFSGKKLTKHKMRVMFFSTLLSETFLIPCRIQWATIITVHRPSGKASIILLDFNET